MCGSGCLRRLCRRSRPRRRRRRFSSDAAQVAFCVEVFPESMNTPVNPGTKPSQPRFGRLDLGLDAVVSGIERATNWLLKNQHEDGYWCGELEADVMLE